jgi:hypothetical protein
MEKLKLYGKIKNKKIWCEIGICGLHQLISSYLEKSLGNLQDVTDVL